MAGTTSLVLGTAIDVVDGACSTSSGLENEIVDGMKGLAGMDVVLEMEEAEKEDIPPLLRILERPLSKRLTRKEPLVLPLLGPTPLCTVVSFKWEVRRAGPWEDGRVRSGRSYEEDEKSR